MPVHSSPRVVVGVGVHPPPLISPLRLPSSSSSSSSGTSREPSPVVGPFQQDSYINQQQQHNQQQQQQHLHQSDQKQQQNHFQSHHQQQRQHSPQRSSNRSSRTSRNQQHITILSPRALVSTVPGVVLQQQQQPPSSSSSSAPSTSVSTSSSVPGLTQRLRVSTASSNNTLGTTTNVFPTNTNPPHHAGYSYTSRSHRERGGVGGGGGGIGSSSSRSHGGRYNFHAASLAERAASESLSHAAEAMGLSHATLSAFGAASIPMNASSSLTYYSNHPVTFGTQPGLPQPLPTPPPPTIPAAVPAAVGYANGVGGGGGGGGRVSPSSRFIHASTYDTNTISQLPPLTGYRPGSKEHSLSYLGGFVGGVPTPPTVVLKHDRAVQTDPAPSSSIGTPAHTPMVGNGTNMVNLNLPQPLTTIASSIVPPSASSAAGSASIAASGSSASPAPIGIDPSPSSFVPSRRFGYESAHLCLLQFHHPNVWANSIEEGLEEDGLDLEETETETETHSSHKHSLRTEDTDRLKIHHNTFDPIDSFTMIEDSLANFYLTLGKWDEFDIFQLYDLTNGWPLSFLFMMIDKKHHFLESNNIDPVTAFHFIQEVESNYLPNPYHHSTHAADVLHAAFHLVENTPILKNGLSTLDCFLLYISSAVHDLQHPGVNNAFLVNSRAPLALRYNDRSVLESFHISSAFRLMQLHTHCNILGGFNFPEYSKIRKTLVDLVLATDLAVHFELMGVFKRKLHMIDVRASEEDRLMIMQIILKCGDLSHPARSRRLHLKWSELVTEEFFLQGDKEKILSLPPSMFMDRHSTNLAQSQIGFITFLVFPMFQAYSTFSNRDYWSRKVEENLEWWHEVARIEGEEKKLEAERLEQQQQQQTHHHGGGLSIDVSGDGNVEELFTQSEPNSASVVHGGGGGVVVGNASISTSSNVSSHGTSRRGSSDSTAILSLKETKVELPSATTSASATSIITTSSSTNVVDTSTNGGTRNGDSITNRKGSSNLSKLTLDINHDSSSSTSTIHHDPSNPSSTVPDPSASTTAGKSTNHTNNLSTDDTTTSVSTGQAISPRPNKIQVGPIALNSTTSPNTAPPLDRLSRRKSGDGTSASSSSSHSENRSSQRTKKSSRRSMTSSLVTENLALLSETAQVAALAAAGASATEAKEHQEEEQAEAAAAAAAAAAMASNSNHSPANKPLSSHTLGLTLLPTHKRKSVMNGVAPPASPLVLHRGLSLSSSSILRLDDDSNVQVSSPSMRSLGVTLSERRAMSLSGGGVGSPLQTSQRGSLNIQHNIGTSSPRAPLGNILLDEQQQQQQRTNSSARSSCTTLSTAASPTIMTNEDTFERAFNAITINKDGTNTNGNDSTTPSSTTSTTTTTTTTATRPLTHQEELEWSHGALYREVRELAALTAVELQAAAATTPVPTLAPSYARTGAIPAFSKKAHALLEVRTTKTKE